MPPETTPCRIFVVGVSPRMRRVYRDLRKYGMARRDANVATAGACFATGDGRVLLGPHDGTVAEAFGKLGLR